MERRVQEKMQQFCEYFSYPQVLNPFPSPTPRLLGERCVTLWGWQLQWKYPLNTSRKKITITQKNAYLTYDNIYIFGFVFLRLSW